MKKRRFQTIGRYEVDGATSSRLWGKSPYKRYKGVAGNGGKTTNFGGGGNA